MSRNMKINENWYIFLWLRVLRGGKIRYNLEKIKIHSFLFFIFSLFLSSSTSELLNEAILLVSSNLYINWDLPKNLLYFTLWLRFLVCFHERPHRISRLHRRRAKAWKLYDEIHKIENCSILWNEGSCIKLNMG